MLNRRLFAVCSALVVGSALVLIAAVSAASKSGGVSLSGGRPATAVDLYAPEDVTFDAAGNVYFSEFGTSKTTGHRVNEVDPAGNLRVIAGTGVEGYGGDGGPATLARLDSPTGLLIDGSGALVVADHHNGCMRRIDASGVINAIVGYCGRLGYNGDGKFPPLKTKFDDPIGIVEDSTGTMFVADEQNARVRRVTPDGVVSTILGGGKIPLPDAVDGTLGTSIKMSHPSYLALDANGNLYVSDFLWNEVVRHRSRRDASRTSRGLARPGSAATAGRRRRPCWTSRPASRSTLADASTSPTPSTTGSGWSTRTGASRP